MEFASTNLAHNVAHGLYNEKGYDVGETHVEKLYYTLFYGVAHVLKDNKSKEAPTTFTISGKYLQEKKHKIAKGILVK